MYLGVCIGLQKAFSDAIGMRKDLNIIVSSVHVKYFFKSLLAERVSETTLKYNLIYVCLFTKF